MDEVTELADTLRKDATAGVAVSTQKMFNAAVLNSLWRIMTGQRFSHDDKELDRILDSIQKSLTAPVRRGTYNVFLNFINSEHTLPERRLVFTRIIVQRSFHVRVLKKCRYANCHELCLKILDAF